MPLSGATFGSQVSKIGAGVWIKQDGLIWAGSVVTILAEDGIPITARDGCSDPAARTFVDTADEFDVDTMLDGEWTWRLPGYP